MLNPVKIISSVRLKTIKRRVENIHKRANDEQDVQGSQASQVRDSYREGLDLAERHGIRYMALHMRWHLGLVHYHREEYEEAIAVLAPLLEKELELEPDETEFCSPVFTPAYYEETALVLTLGAGTMAEYPDVALAKAAERIEYLIEHTPYVNNKGTDTCLLLQYWDRKQASAKILGWLAANKDAARPEDFAKYRVRALIRIKAWKEAAAALDQWQREPPEVQGSQDRFWESHCRAQLLQARQCHSQAWELLQSAPFYLAPNADVLAAVPVAAAVSYEGAWDLIERLRYRQLRKTGLERMALWQALGDAHLARALDPSPESPFLPEAGIAPELPTSPDRDALRDLHRAGLCYRRALASALTLEKRLGLPHLVPAILCRMELLARLLERSSTRARTLCVEQYPQGVS